jgi:folate-dependent phosphoribosylglycinamide formyltransferase PurN
MNKPQVVLCTGSSLRHRYFTNRIAQDVDLRGVVVETKPLQVSQSNQTDLIKEHLSDFRSRQETLFKNTPSWHDFEVPILKIDTGEVNNLSTHEWVKALNADTLLLYGTAIVREPLLSLYEDKVINLHMGLSPYYRGTATNVWPLINGEPEAVGATFHIATNKVDQGPIIHQVRPQLSDADDCHDIGLKTLIIAGEVCGNIISNYSNQQTNLKPQRLEGKLYRKSDFNQKAVVKLRQNLKNNMIPLYLASKKLRDKSFPMTTQNLSNVTHR